jgi:hypothetical protein
MGTYDDVVVNCASSGDHGKQDAMMVGQFQKLKRRDPTTSVGTFKEIGKQMSLFVRNNNAVRFATGKDDKSWNGNITTNQTQSQRSIDAICST